MRRFVAVTGIMAAMSAPWAGATASAQNVNDLASLCVSAGGLPVLCTASAVAGRALLGDVGALTAPGSEVPGESTTLGNRLGGMPRLAPWVRFSGMNVSLPDLSDPTVKGESSSFTTAVHSGIGLGLFDGIQLLPTVGGFLSLDAVGQVSFLFFPENEGFDGRVDVYSFGARVGLLRESFTLPGVSVSVTRRLMGAMRYGNTGAGDPADVAVDPSVTSVRATVGKDLFAFGVVAGVGWDDYSADVQASAQHALGAPTGGRTTLEASRRHYFVGLSRQIGILSWVSAEVGWARGFGAVPSYTGDFDPEGTSLFGSVSLLFKL